ncbi:MAG: amino acid-binding protein [Parasporobacterium sp.]|nr:amino acid-binding protein [Parasporobacterium sp.]
MAVKQLTIYVDNKPGATAEITGLLTGNGIDMYALSLADADKFGILRLIVNEPEKAVAVLAENEIIAGVIDVTAVKMAHETGGFDKVLKVLSDNNININYMYAFVAVSGDSAFAVLHFDDTEKGQGVLRAAGFDVIEGNIF